MNAQHQHNHLSDVIPADHTCRPLSRVLALTLILGLAGGLKGAAAGCPPGYLQQAAFSPTGTPAFAAASVNIGSRDSAVVGCESFSENAILFIHRDTGATLAVLPKRLAKTYEADSNSYLNYTKEEVLASPADLLGNALLQVVYR